MAEKDRFRSFAAKYLINIFYQRRKMRKKRKKKRKEKKSVYMSRICAAYCIFPIFTVVCAENVFYSGSM